MCTPLIALTVEKCSVQLLKMESQEQLHLCMMCCLEEGKQNALVLQQIQHRFHFHLIADRMSILCPLSEGVWENAIIWKNALYDDYML